MSASAAISVAAFVLGCTSAYLVLASAGAGVVLLGMGSHLVYGLLAGALLVLGVRTLWIQPHEDRECSSPSLGAGFLGGAASSFLGSPCCTPVAFAIGMQAAQHEPLLAGVTLLMFGLGHALPLVAAVFAAALFPRRKTLIPSSIRATISGALLTAIGGLYAILA